TRDTETVFPQRVRRPVHHNVKTRALVSLDGYAQLHPILTKGHASTWTPATTDGCLERPPRPLPLDYGQGERFVLALPGWRRGFGELPNARHATEGIDRRLLAPEPVVHHRDGGGPGRQGRLNRQRETQRVGRRHVHRVPKILQRPDRDDAQRIGAAVQEAGHQLVAQHALAPVRIDRPRPTRVLDGHLLTQRVRRAADLVERRNGRGSAEIRVVDHARRRLILQQAERRPHRADAKHVAHLVEYHRVERAVRLERRHVGHVKAHVAEYGQSAGASKA